MAWLIKEWLYNSVWVLITVCVVLLIAFWLDVIGDHNEARLALMIQNNIFFSAGVVLLAGAIITAATYKKER